MGHEGALGGAGGDSSPSLRVAPQWCCRQAAHQYSLHVQLPLQLHTYACARVCAHLYAYACVHARAYMARGARPRTCVHAHACTRIGSTYTRTPLRGVRICVTTFARDARTSRTHGRTRAHIRRSAQSARVQVPVRVGAQRVCTRMGVCRYLRYVRRYAYVRACTHGVPALTPVAGHSSPMARHGPCTPL